MKITAFKASLEFLVKAELTPFIWGHAGIGKSSIVRQYAEDKGFHFFPFYLGTQSDLGDILGLADFVRDKNGTAVATTFATPEWLMNTIKYCQDNPDSGAIIFLDEFNRARRDILNGMFSLALDKTFHTIKLPKNCHVIAAGNPPTDEYFTTDVNETALMARFVHIKLEPTFDEWVTYATDRKLESSLIEFLKQQPNLLEDKRTDFQLPVKVDRRSFERLSKLFKLNTPEHLLNGLMPGIIGLERTVAYMQFLKEQDRPLEGAEVLAGKKQELLKKWSGPENVLASFLNLTCDKLKSHISELDKEGKTLTPEQKNNLMHFFSTVPKDISYTLIKLFVDNGSNLFRDFYMDDKFMQPMVGLVKTAKGKGKDKS